MMTQEPGMTPDKTPAPTTEPQFGGLDGLLRLIETVGSTAPKPGLRFEMSMPRASKKAPGGVHKIMIVTYFDDSEAHFRLEGAWNVSKNNGLLNLKVCPLDWGSKIRRMSIPLTNIKHFRVEDES